MKQNTNIKNKNIFPRGKQELAQPHFWKNTKWKNCSFLFRKAAENEQILSDNWI